LITQGADAEYKKQLADAFEKLERQRLANELLERVRRTTDAWDITQLSGADEEGEIRAAIAKLLVQGQSNEKHFEQTRAVVRELADWMDELGRRDDGSHQIEIR